MKIFEVTGPEVGGNVQYQSVPDKGPKTPEQLAAINAQRAASGEQAAVVADTQARMASGLYAQPPGTTATTPVKPAAQPATQPATSQATATSAAPKQPPAPTTGQYVVKAGDTLTKIASQMGTNLQTLLQANPQFKANPNLIKPGQTVNPPSGSEPKPGATVTTTPASPSPASTPAPPAGAPTPAATPASNYYVQPATVGMNGETDYVVVDREKGLEVKSFNSQAEADAWIKQQPMSESLSRLLQVAGLK